MSRARPSAPRFACLAAGALFLGLVTPALVAAAPQAPAIDPWRALTELRLHLAASGALGAKFRQSYVPAGFATGDEETGRVALALPDWLDALLALPLPADFSQPWISVRMQQGERLHVEARDEAGLDLLLLPVEQLQERYRAVAKVAAGGAIDVELVPTDPGSRIAQAQITFDLASQRPTALAYRDRDGNRSSFRFEAFESVGDATLFTPPSTLIWKEP